MTDSRRHAVKSVPWLPVALGVAGAIATITAAALAGVTLVVARTVVTPPTRRLERTRILSVDGAGDLVTLTSTADSRLPGEYSLFFAAGAGHARVGEIVAETPARVIRRLLGVDRGDLARSRRGRFSGWYYTGPAELGFPFENVDIQTELGPAPAWLAFWLRYDG